MVPAARDTYRRVYRDDGLDEDHPWFNAVVTAYAATDPSAKAKQSIVDYENIIQLYLYNRTIGFCVPYYRILCTTIFN